MGSIEKWKEWTLDQVIKYEENCSKQRRSKWDFKVFLDREENHAPFKKRDYSHQDWLAEAVQITQTQDKIVNALDYADFEGRVFLKRSVYYTSTNTFV